MTIAADPTEALGPRGRDEWIGRLVQELREEARRMDTVDDARAGVLRRAASALEDVHAAYLVQEATMTSRRITDRASAFALGAGAVVVNDQGKAFQIRPSETAAAGYIDHATAAWLLPVTVIHEGSPS